MCLIDALFLVAVGEMAPPEKVGKRATGERAKNRAELVAGRSGLQRF